MYYCDREGGWNTEQARATSFSAFLCIQTQLMLPSHKIQSQVTSPTKERNQHKAHHPTSFATSRSSYGEREDKEE